MNNEQEKTNEQLKEEILIELFNTGRINGLYFGKTSTSKLNPLKMYIKNCLYKTYILENMGVQDNDFISDVYMELFCNLQNIPADKFIELYNQSKVKGTNLIRYALRIIILKGFAKGRNNNPKHSLVNRLGFASVFNAGNFQITPLENDDTDNASSNLIIYDTEDESEFESQYGFTPEEIISHMTPEEKFVFYKLLGKQPRGAQSKESIKQREKLIEAVKQIKKKIEIKKGLNDEKR